MKRLLQSYRDGDELELRFGKMSKHGFNPSIDEFTYSQLIGKYTSDEWPRVKKRYAFWRSKNRKRVIKDLDSGEVTGRMKKTIGNVEFMNGRVRLSLSREIPIAINNTTINNHPKIIRERNEFISPDGQIRVDLTKDVYNRHRVHFQFEIEFVSGNGDQPPTQSYIMSTIEDAMSILSNIQLEKRVVNDFNHLVLSSSSSSKPRIIFPTFNHISEIDFPFMFRTHAVTPIHSNWMDSNIYFASDGIYLITPGNNTIKLTDDIDPKLEGTVLLVGHNTNDTTTTKPNNIIVRDILINNFSSTDEDGIYDSYENRYNRYITPIVEKYGDVMSVFPLTVIDENVDVDHLLDQWDNSSGGDQVDGMLFHDNDVTKRFPDHLVWDKEKSELTLQDVLFLLSLVIPDHSVEVDPKLVHEKVNKFIHHTKNPHIFDRLSQHTGNNLVELSYQNEVENIKDLYDENQISEIVPLLHDYFNKK